MTSTVQAGDCRLAEITYFNPPELGSPLGQYSQVTRVKQASEHLYIAGQVGMTKDGRIGEDFAEQCAIMFANTHEALRACGATWDNVVLFTTYLVHSQDIPKFMKYRLEHFPRLWPAGRFPPNTLLMVDRLVQEPLLVEVQTIAAI